jgi:RNA polymerase sigma-70 factor (ECF subfamily)
MSTLMSSRSRRESRVERRVSEEPDAALSAESDLTTLDGRLSEAQLVDEARRGCQRAFGDLVLRYERRVVRVIAQFVRDEDLAQDLAQEAFLRAYQRLDQFDPARRFGPWLFRIGVNLTLDYLRRRKRRGWWSVFTDASADRSPDPATADPRLQLDLRQEVEAVLNRIPEKYRTVLVLRDLENFSTSEIAAITNRKEATIRWRLAEARQRFQQLWIQRRDGHGVVWPSPVDDAIEECG